MLCTYIRICTYVPSRAEQLQIFTINTSTESGSLGWNLFYLRITDYMLRSGNVRIEAPEGNSLHACHFFSSLGSES